MDIYHGGSPTPFAMVLLLYPIARRILNASRKGRKAELPTLYQLSLLLDTLSGSTGSLWSWFTYQRWKRRERINGVSKIVVFGFVTVTGLG